MKFSKEEKKRMDAAQSGLLQAAADLVLIAPENALADKVFKLWAKQCMEYAAKLGKFID